MTTLDTARAQPGWRFWFLWMLASLGGAIVFMAVIPPLVNPFVGDGSGGGFGIPEWEMSIIVGAVSQVTMGAAIGLAQWLVLRRVLSGMGWWVLATLVGYSAGIVAPWIVNSLEGGRLTGLFVLLIYGFVLGMAQWLVLRTHFHRAVWWVAFSMAAWALAWALTGLAVVAGIYVEPFDLLSAFLIPVAVAGGGIIWLVRRSGSPTRNLGGANILDRGLS